MQVTDSSHLLMNSYTAGLSILLVRLNRDIADLNLRVCDILFHCKCLKFMTKWRSVVCKKFSMACLVNTIVHAAIVDKALKSGRGTISGYIEYKYRYFICPLQIYSTILSVFHVESRVVSHLTFKTCYKFHKTG